MQFFFLMLATIFHKTWDFEKKICKKIQKLHYFLNGIKSKQQQKQISFSSPKKYAVENFKQGLKTLHPPKKLHCKLCHYLNEATIKSIYYTIFNSHLSYVCNWGQNLNPKLCRKLLQKKHVDFLFCLLWCPLITNFCKVKYNQVFWSNLVM